MCRDGPSGAGQEAVILAVLGRAVYRRRLPVIAGWAMVALAGAVFGGSVYDRTQSIDGAFPGTPAAVAQDRLDALDPEGERVVALISGRNVGSIDLIDSVSRISFEIRAMPGVATVEDSYTTARRQISEDNLSSLMTVELAPGLSDDEALEVASTPPTCSSVVGCWRSGSSATRPSGTRPSASPSP
jgi:RND superfamily putative drug exporter